METTIKRITDNIENYVKNKKYEYKLTLILKYLKRKNIKLTRGKIKFLSNLYYDDTNMFKRFISFYNRPSNEQFRQDLYNFTLKYGKHAEEKLAEFKLKTSHSLNGFIKRNGEEEGRRLYKLHWENSNFRNDLSTYIKRFGEEEGKKRYDELWKNLSYKRTYEYHKTNNTLDKKIEIEERKKQTKIKNNTVGGGNMTSKDSFISRYGEVLGEEKYKNFILKSSFKNPISINFWLSKGFTLKEALEKVSEEQTRRGNISNGSVSKESKQFFEEIIKECEELGFNKKDIFSGGYSSELCLVNPLKKYYMYDFCIEPLKIVIEYQGERFHIYDENSEYEIERLKRSNFLKVEDIINKQKHKRQIAEENGYEYYEYFAVTKSSLYFKDNIIKRIKEKYRSMNL